MDFKFRMPELLAVLSYFIYSQNAILSYTLITLAILSSLARFLIDFSNQNSELSLLKKRVIMSNEERKFVINKMADLNGEEEYYGDGFL